MKNSIRTWILGLLTVLFLGVLGCGLLPPELTPAWLHGFIAEARDRLARPYLTLGNFQVTTGFLLKTVLFLAFLAVLASLVRRFLQLRLLRTLRWMRGSSMRWRGLSVIWCLPSASWWACNRPE